MTISLVIPAFNEESQIGHCLESVLKNSGGRLYEIIVVDNASTDRTSEIAGSFSGVRVVHESRKGTGPARNAGYLAASGDLVAYMDADCRLPSNWIDKIEVAFADPTLVLLSGPYSFYNASSLANAVIYGLFWVWFPIAGFFAGDTAIGGNMVMRRLALQKINGFDTSIDFYGEDTDIAARISKYGKVRFDTSFYIYSSARRYHHEGIVHSLFMYTLNGFWWILFRKPYSSAHEDVR